MTTTPRYLRFTHSPIPIVAIVTFVTTVATLSVVTHLVLLGPDVSNYANHISDLVSLPFFAFIFLGTWGILRYEGVSITDIGLGKSTFLPAVLAFGLLWGWITVVGIGYLTATGATTAIGFSFDSPWYWVPVWFLLTLTLSNGLTEELVFRGYIQNKCTALMSSRSQVPSTAVGIVAAALLFGVPHIPLGLILAGASPRAIPWIILGNFIPGTLYGVIYYLTRNVWYAGFFHGFGNATVVPFDATVVPFFTPFVAVSAVLIALGYRRWGRNTHRVTIDIRERTFGSTG